MFLESLVHAAGLLLASPQEREREGEAHCCRGCAAPVKVEGLKSTIDGNLNVFVVGVARERNVFVGEVEGSNGEDEGHHKSGEDEVIHLRKGTGSRIEVNCHLLLYMDEVIHLSEGTGSLIRHEEEEEEGDGGDGGLQRGWGQHTGVGRSFSEESEGPSQRFRTERNPCCGRERGREPEVRRQTWE